MPRVSNRGRGLGLLFRGRRYGWVMELVLQRSVSQRGTVEGPLSEHNAGDSSPTIPIPQGAGAFLSPEAWLPLPAVPVGGLASHRPPWSWTSCIPVARRGAQKGRTKVPPAVLQLQVLFGRSWAAPPGSGAALCSAEVESEPPRRGEGTFISSHPVICST